MSTAKSRLQVLIGKAQERAYKNAYEQRDPDVSAQLRDGIKYALFLFKEIDSAEKTTASLLEEMLLQVQKALQHYRGLSGSEGEWECSALCIMEADITGLIENDYQPTEEDLKKAENTMKAMEEEQLKTFVAEISGLF